MMKKSPDQISAERLAGQVSATAAMHGDGTLIEDPAIYAPLVLNDRTFKDVSDTVCGYTEQPAPLWWYAAITVSSATALLAAVMIPYLIITGVGVWGLNNQVDWAWEIGRAHV